MRVDAIASISFGLTAAVVCNAFYKKEQFYPSVVYLTKSNPSMAVIYIQALVLVVLFGKLLRKIFFGQLRAAETEHLIERSWYAVTETCLAFTVFRDDFSPRFIGLFTVLLFLKCFHWLVEDRVDYMERSPVISLLFHVRAVLLLALLFVLDSFFIHHAYHSTLIKGASVQLVFGFEYAILITVVAMIGVKYVLHTIDLQRENPWENKSVYLLYTELFLGFAKVLLYILFMGIMIKVHTLPLFAIRPMYLTTRAFKKAVHDVIMSRRAIRNMNSLYPNATAEDLEATDNVCIICREEMRAAPAAAPAGGGGGNNNNGSARAKKLPCGHIFHINCLRSWFQRQQTCPTCRIDILRQPAAAAAAAAAGNRNPNEAAVARAAVALERVRAAAAEVAGGANAAAPGAAAAAPEADRNQRVAARVNVAVAGPPFAFMPPFFPPPPPPPPPSAPGGDGASASPTARPPPFPAFPFPTPPFLFAPPPPSLSPPSTSDLSSLTAEQLRSIEAEERSRVEARILILRNIQTLLDSAVAQMNLYVNSTSAPASGTVDAAGGGDSESVNASAETTAADSPVEVISTAASTSDAAAEASLDFPRPPTADTGAIPKAAPRLPPKTSKATSAETALASESEGVVPAASREDSSVEPGEEASDVEEKDGVRAAVKGGEGDVGSDEASEIRRRRLEKLSSPASKCEDSVVPEAAE